MAEGSLAVSAWIGSANVGDELVFAGLRAALRDAGIQRPVVAFSVDPRSTASSHGVDAVAAHGPRQVLHTLRRCVGLVFGGGGIVQDETSWLNLPYHASRPALARLLGRPLAGIGLGAGPLRLWGSNRTVRIALSSAVAVTARDAESAGLLGAAGVPAETGADLAWHLEPTGGDSLDRLGVCLRPWTGRPGRLPVRARRPVSPGWYVEGVARALDVTVEAAGLDGCHFVAVGGPGDHAVHREVAARMQAPATFAQPGWRDVAGELATTRAVVSMRYHGGVAAVLGGRPPVLLAYSPKVSSLAADLGPAARSAAWTAGADAAAVAAAVDGALGTDGGAVAAARRRLRERGQVDLTALRRLDAAAAS